MPNNGFGKAAGAHGNGAVSPTLPSFFIIGPPRTGTTWLQAVLSEYAWLSHPTKETRFFDKHFERGLGWYGSHYQRVAEGRVVGEVAPTYFASAVARERIRSLIPHAKIVCTFRNPVDRIVSLYRLKRAYGLIPWDFEEALARDPELIETSQYSTHLQEWQKTFGHSQVLVTFHDDMQADPQAYLDRLVEFIGVPRVKLRSSQVRSVLSSEEMTEPRNYYWTRAGILLAEWSRARRLDKMVAAAKRFGAMKLFVGGGRRFGEISYTQRAKLRERFRPEVDALASMLNRDFSGWR